MITIDAFSTQASKQGRTEYNFRDEDDIRRFVYYTLKGNAARHPIYAGSRGFRHTVYDPSGIADEIIYIQSLYNKESGLRIRGLILTISKKELFPEVAPQQVSIIAERFSDYIFLSGFQTTYGVFDQGECYEIYYAINTVSYVNGVKFHQNHTDILADEQLCAETVVADVTGRAIDVRFDFDSLEYA